ncbi:alkaline phosphatase family protein [Pelagibius sp.]|uniref:alkaline phosphatase family protein n=1 Tax=Pelagibius sp. TaxID=1931238 RepID=UPI00262B0382|nr:alkaline phosphatase family protein [Pelagibius sp.]
MTKSGRPNVLLITADQWRGDCLSAMGHPVLRTPNIDRLVGEGVLFARHYAGSAPCSPGRACLYTGLYLMNHRVCINGTPLDRRHDTIALAARRAGYEPTLFGYTDAAADPRDYDAGDPALTTYEGVLPGFAVRQALPDHSKPWLSWLAQQGVDVSGGKDWLNQPQGGASEPPTTAPPLYDRTQTQTAFLVEAFARWLGEQTPERPWFAHLSLLRPHPPFVVPAPFNALYAPGAGPAFARHSGWQREAAAHPYLRFAIERQQKGTFLPGLEGRVCDWGAEAFDTIRAVYFGMVAEVDDQLGRVWAALEAAGFWNDTVIALTSDHGEMMGDHWMLGKGGFFDASYHIPLIVRDPHLPAAFGSRVERFSEAVDVMPTLLDLLGAPVPAQLDGRSLAPFLRGAPPADWRAAVHWEYDFRNIETRDAEAHFGLPPHRCNLTVIRDDAMKYVHFAGLPPLLFDLECDPMELENRAEDPAYADRRLHLAEAMLDWRARHLDQSLALTQLTEGGPVTAA